MKNHVKRRKNHAKRHAREMERRAELADANVAAAPVAAVSHDGGAASRLRALLSALRWRPSRGEARAVIFALAVRVVVALAMLMFGHNYLEIAETFDLRAYFPGAPSGIHQHYTKGAPVWYLPLVNWDGQHYLLLSDRGYNINYDVTGGQQFFPLYPLLIRAFSLAFPQPVSAMLLNYLFIAGFCAFLYRIGAHYGCRWPALPVVMVMAFPTAFFASAFYSEPLFLFLTAGFFYYFFCARRRAYLVYFALLPLSRGAAVFVFGGLMLYGLLEFARFLAARRAASMAEAMSEPAAEAAVAPVAFAWRPYAECAAVFVLGAAAYLAFFQLVVGDAFAGLTAQQRYNSVTYSSIVNLFKPQHFWTLVSGEMLRVEWFVWGQSRSDHWVMWVMLAASIAFVALREWRLLCFYFPLIYCHATMGYLVSYQRYALTAMPFLALALAKHARLRWHAALVFAFCAAAFLLQLYLAARFSVNLWVA